MTHNATTLENVLLDDSVARIGERLRDAERLLRLDIARLDAKLAALEAKVDAALGLGALTNPRVGDRRAVLAELERLRRGDAPCE